MTKGTSLKFKLFLGFASLMLFLIITGGIGYWAVNTLGNAMTVITDDEAPLVDAAMEMKITIEETLMNLDEFKAATAVIPTDNKSKVAPLKEKFDELVKNFDMFGGLMLEGGTFEGKQFNPTDNPALRAKVQEADTLHNDGLQPAVTKLHMLGEQLLEKKEKRDTGMGNMESAFEEVLATAVITEDAVKESMDRKMRLGDVTGAMNAEVRWADMVMELKTTIALSRIRLEEIVQQTKAEDVEPIIGEFNQTLKDFDKWIDALLVGGETDEGYVPKVADPKVRVDVEKLDEIHNNVFQKAAGNLIMSQKAVIDTMAEMQTVIGEVDEIGDKQSELLGEAEALAGGEMDAARDMGYAAWSQASWTMMAVIIIALIAGIVIGTAITAAISKPIMKVVEALTEGSAQVTSASAQISETSQSLAGGATEQASSLEETSSSLEEISSMTKQNADNANSANSLMDESRRMVETGVHSMKEMVGAMDSIKQSSGEISKIIKVIEEIAFQTNLLALNAAVEAARAGEHGKGFAVVAEEVRNLAQRSATASKDTASLIENAVKKSEDGAQIVDEAAKALDAIADSTKKVGDLVGEIAAASNEQANGIDQVNQAVSQMDQVTQSNAAAAEESASASEELSAQAESVNTVVIDLKRIVEGGSGDRVHAPLRKPAKRETYHAPAPQARKTPALPQPHHHAPAPQKKAAPARAKGPKTVEPEAVIPFDDDDDFKDF